MVIKHRQEDIVLNQSDMFQAISELDHHMGQTQHALLLQGQECSLCSQISDNKSRVSSLHVVAMFLEGKTKEDYDKAIKDFELALDNKRECLTNFSNQLAAVVGCPLLPSPPLPSAITALPPPLLVASLPPPPAISPPAAQASSHPLSVSEPSNPVKKRKISGPMVPPASCIMCSTSLLLTASLPNMDALGTSMVQDVNLVSSNYMCSLYSSPDNMGVQHISNKSDEVSPTTTNITKLMENHDVRLA
jgi:hypothetical protein